MGPTDGLTDAAICVGLAQLTLGGVIWSEQAEGTTTWIERPPVAGRTSRLIVTLTNGSSMTFLQYPGVSLTTTSPAVTFMRDFRLFGIQAGESVSLDWYVMFGSTLAPGTQVHFRAEVFGDDVRRTRCADSPAIEFDVVLQ